MDFFDSDMKDYFNRQSQEDIPEGYDWDDMKEPIFHKMGTAQQTAARSRSWFRKFWLVAPLFAILCLATYFLSQKSSPLDVNDPADGLLSEPVSPELPLMESSLMEKITLEQPKEKIVADNRKDKVAQATTAQTTTTKASVKEVNQTGVTSKATSSPTTTAIEKAATQSMSLAPRRMAETTTRSLTSGTRQPSTAQLETTQSNIATNTTPEESVPQSTTFSEQQTTTEKPTQQPLESLPNKGERPLVVEPTKADGSTLPKVGWPQETETTPSEESPSLANEPVLRNIPTPVPSLSEDTVDSPQPKTEAATSTLPTESLSTKAKAQISLLLIGGANSWTMPYEGDNPYADLKRETTTPGLGWQVSSGIRWKGRKGFYLQGRLTLNKLENRFQHSLERDTLVLVENAHVSTHTHGINSVRREIYRDTTIIGSFHRSVEQYNYSRLLSFELSGGKEWEAGRWRITTGAGLAFSHLHMKEGKDLDRSGRIYDYDQSSARLKRTHLSLHAGIGVFYQLSNKLSAGVQSSVLQSLNNWSEEDGVDLKPRINNLGIGLRYRLR